MSKKIARGTAENLRFIAPNGEIISSPDGHVHMAVIEEQKLSSLTGFEGLMDVITNGYAIIAFIKEEILITHTRELGTKQAEAVKRLRDLFPDYKISLVREEM